MKGVDLTLQPRFIALYILHGRLLGYEARRIVVIGLP